MMTAQRMFETQEVIRRAYLRISEHGWTTGALARDSQGDPVEPQAQAAVAFSVPGAIYAAAREIGYHGLGIPFDVLALVWHERRNTQPPNVFEVINGADAIDDTKGINDTLVESEAAAVSWMVASVDAVSRWRPMTMDLGDFAYGSLCPIDSAQSKEGGTL